MQMTKQCCICGKDFSTNRRNQVTCGNAECKKEQHKEYLRNYMTQYRNEHKAEINRKNRDYMRKVRSAEEPQEDTLIGLDYAERQKAKTLAMVGKVRI